MRPERRQAADYLADMVEAADWIAEFISGLDLPGFLADYHTCSAVMFQFIILGEAAAHVPADIVARYPDIAWSDAVGFRNYAAHGYFALTWSRVWDTATTHVPVLRGQIVELIQREFGSEG